MTQKVSTTAVFDIGKTNKKFFLFDKDLNEVYRVYHRLPYATDDDGDPCESLRELTEWMKEVFRKAQSNPKYEIKQINFSSYGASLVHLDRNGDPISALYDYLKLFPPDLLREFYAKYGSKDGFSQQTASPPMGMLNSGLQLYWLKKHKPDLFDKIRYSLHLPQFLSYVFTGKMVSDYTSIGCHTGMWDFQKNHYHTWIRQESLDHLLPPLVSADTLIPAKSVYGNVQCGPGIHDSSSALLPYLMTNERPFILLSTGTWAITLNPFNSLPLTNDELARDCLQYMNINGDPVKASRMFIGEEHKYQIELLYNHFQKTAGTYKKLKYDSSLHARVREIPKRFHFKFLDPLPYMIDMPERTDLENFSSFEEAYYAFINELTDLQAAATRLVITSGIEKIFVDGGFNSNEVFVEMMRQKLAPLKLHISNGALGSALGAALIIRDKTMPSRQLTALQSYLPAS